MLPHDGTDEVEKTPKEVAIDADANDCIRAPKGDGGGNGCPNEASSFDSSAGDDLKDDEACIPGELQEGSHEIVDCNAPSNEQDDAAYRKCSWRKAKIPVKDPLDLNTQVDDQ